MNGVTLAIIAAGEGPEDPAGNAFALAERLLPEGVSRGALAKLAGFTKTSQQRGLLRP